MKADARRGIFDPNPGFAFEVAFGEGEVVNGAEVAGTLKQIVAAVEDAVAQLAPLLKAAAT